jgi:hypothetical protein
MFWHDVKSNAPRCAATQRPRAARASSGSTNSPRWGAQRSPVQIAAEGLNPETAERRQQPIPHRPAQLGCRRHRVRILFFTDPVSVPIFEIDPVILHRLALKLLANSRVYHVRIGGPDAKRGSKLARVPAYDRANSWFARRSFSIAGATAPGDNVSLMSISNGCGPPSPSTPQTAAKRRDLPFCSGVSEAVSSFSDPPGSAGKPAASGPSNTRPTESPSIPAAPPPPATSARARIGSRYPSAGLERGFSSQPSIRLEYFARIGWTRLLKYRWNSPRSFILYAFMKACTCSDDFHCAPFTSSPPIWKNSSGNNSAIS